VSGSEAFDYFPQSFGTIRRWLGEIIAYFDCRTTQGTVEGINNKLKDEATASEILRILAIDVF
jgi:hypothetical protein